MSSLPPSPGFAWRTDKRTCDFYGRNLPEPVPKDAKSVPKNIERKVFKETGIVGYRLKDAA
jgi:hypothetical protein